MNATDRRIVALALPALGSLAVEPLYILVDTAIVGRLGTAQLGGLALAATVLGLVVAACNFLTYGTTERVARRIGAGDREGAANVAVQTLWLSAIVGLVVAPFIALSASWLADGLGGDGDVLAFGATYLRIGALGIPFVVFALGAQGVQRGASDYRTPLVILLTANTVNAVLEILFVYGFEWGVPGSAWSTVLAQVGAGVAFAVVVRRHLAGATQRRPSRAGMAPLMTAGRHLLLRVGSMLAVTVGATAIAARADEATLAAHQIGAGLLLFLALALDALAIPAQTLVAEELGSVSRASLRASERGGSVSRASLRASERGGSVSRASLRASERGSLGSAAGAAEIARRCVRLSVIVGVGLGALLVALAPILPHAFTDDPAVVERATAVVLWLAALIVPAAVAFAYDGVLIGAGDYRFLGLAAVAYLVAVAPLGAVTVATGAGIAGIWGSLGVWMVVRATCNHVRATGVLERVLVKTAA